MPADGRELLSGSTREPSDAADDSAPARASERVGKLTHAEVATPAPSYPGKRTRLEDDPQAMSPAAALEYARWSIDRKADTTAVDDGALASAFVFLDRSRTGAPLPPPLERRLARELAADLSQLRVHTDPDAARAVVLLGARAATVGSDVYFAAGAYDPTSRAGIELIAHEAAHVARDRTRHRGLSRPDDSHERAADAFARDFVHEPREAPAGVRAEDPGLEREADNHAAAAARGERVGWNAPAIAAVAAGPIHRKTTVTPVPSARKAKLAVLGDGTAANPGLTIPDFDSYIRAQADWFSEPSFGSADRDVGWKLARLVNRGPHVAVALAAFHTGEIAALSAADTAKLEKYTACFDTTAMTIQLATAATTLARALQLGQAVVDIEAFAPQPVLKLVIPESGFIYLVDNAKIAELQTYYTTFKPTLESPDEWPHVQKLLDDGVAKYAPLASWVHDVHIFTIATRDRLLVNVADKSRARPVMLVLFSASDWNTAFLQAKNMEVAVLQAKSLALIVQGMASIADATKEVTRIADDYGQRSLEWDPKKSWLPQWTPGRLAQVVIAGHGSEQSVEMASPGTGPVADEQNRRVAYDQADIDSSNPKANGTELLFDTVISRMDPKDANIVFAGCLVGSHDIPKSTALGPNSATAQKNLQAALAAHPNLAEYVKSRMAAAGVTGTVSAANASTQFGSFNVDAATGKAGLSNPGDPDLGGTKLQYVRTGVEPEGALRAALECYADPAIGPAAVTTEIRTRVAGLAASTNWFEVITRTGFELCLPAVGDVDAGKLLDVVHRISVWLDVLWENTSNPQALADNTKPPEATKVFTAMLGTSSSAQDHVKAGVNEAWIKFDASKGAAFIAALTASSFTRETFKKHLAPSVLASKLAALLPPTATPSKGQLIVALTIAVLDGKGMPAPVRTFLRAAAGGARTTTFPAALGVPALLAPVSELGVLQDIGLAPSSAAGGSGATKVDGNVDTNHDGKNESYVDVAPHDATVNVAKLHVRSRPSSTSTIIDTVSFGDVMRVMGATLDRAWSLVDHNGKTGFVATRFIT